MSKKNTLKDENVMVQQLQGGETVFYTGRRGDSIEVISWMLKCNDLDCQCQTVSFEKF